MHRNKSEQTNNKPLDLELNQSCQTLYLERRLCVLQQHNVSIPYKTLAAVNIQDHPVLTFQRSFEFARFVVPNFNCRILGARNHEAKDGVKLHRRNRTSKPCARDNQLQVEEH